MNHVRSSGQQLAYSLVEDVRFQTYRKRIQELDTPPLTRGTPTEVSPIPSADDSLYVSRDNCVHGVRTMKTCASESLHVGMSGLQIGGLCLARANNPDDGEEDEFSEADNEDFLY